MSERLRALRNLALSSVAAYVENALGILASVLIARTLGPTEFAYYAFAIWLCGWLMRGCNHALTTTSIRFIAEARGNRDDSLARSITGFTLRLQRVSSIIVLTIFVCAVVVVPPDEWRQDLFVIIVLIAVSVYSRAAFWMLGAIGKGFERFEIENLSLMIAALLNAAMVVGWSLAGGHWRGYLAIYCASSLVLVLAGKRLAKRHDVRPEHCALPNDTRRRMTRHIGLTALIVLVGLASNRTIETALLKASSTAEAFAFFAIAGTLTKGAIDFVTSGMAAVLLPAMSRAYGGKGPTAAAAATSEAVRYYWILGLLIAGLSIVVVPGMVSVLYGDVYEEAIPAIVISLVVAGLTTLGSALAALQIAAERQSDQLRVATTTVIANLMLGLALVPAFGLMGAIASSALSSLFSLALTWRFVRQRVQVHIPLGIMCRNALAALVASGAGAGATVLIDTRWAFVVGGIVFIIIYIVGMLMLRCFRHVDFAVFCQLSERLGEPGRHLSRFAARLQTRFSASA